MMKHSIPVIFFSAITLFAVNANAHSVKRYVQAPVISVAPVYYGDEPSVSHQVCYQQRDHHNTAAGTITGGLIGNIIGKNSEATLVGSLIGHSIAAANAPYSQRCVTRNVSSVAGYDVVYRYRGHEYHKFMRQHPGSSVTLRVAVRHH